MEPPAKTEWKIFSNALNKTASDAADDRFAAPRPGGIMLVASHIDHTGILSMRDAWSHLVSKCSETLPSNIETRTHQVDEEREREREREGERKEEPRAYKVSAREIQRANASYLCKRQFPGGVGSAFAYISGILRTHYAVFK